VEYLATWVAHRVDAIASLVTTNTAGMAGSDATISDSSSTSTSSQQQQRTPLRLPSYGSLDVSPPSTLSSPQFESDASSLTSSSITERPPSPPMEQATKPTTEEPSVQPLPREVDLSVPIVSSELDYGNSVNDKSIPISTSRINISPSPQDDHSGDSDRDNDDSDDATKAGLISSILATVPPSSPLLPALPTPPPLPRILLSMSEKPEVDSHRPSTVPSTLKATRPASSIPLPCAPFNDDTPALDLGAPIVPPRYHDDVPDDNLEPTQSTEGSTSKLTLEAFARAILYL
jgi:hypothetical protein